MDEFQWIDALRRALHGHAPASPWGIGDDAAVLPSRAGRCVIATDLMIEEVHFRRSWSSLSDVAWKLYAANASDMWAMGAAPTQWLFSVGWPAKPTQADAEALAEGFLGAMQGWGAADLIGGDTSSADRLTLSLTMLGERAQNPWVRQAFHPGDRLWVDGPLGVSAAGLALLQEDACALTTAEQKCVAQHLRPMRTPSEVQVEVRGAIDVSDGLVADLLHGARASGVRMRLNQVLPGRVLLEDVAKRWNPQPETIHARCDAWQLGGGEDYVRVIGASEHPGPGWTEIGVVEAGAPSVFDERAGERQELTAMGWNHFRAS